MEFEWDELKAAANRSRHHVTFDEARSVFNDPLSLTFPDPQHSEREHRYITLGFSLAGRLLLVVHTDRSGAIRIISARRMTQKERMTYEERS